MHSYELPARVYAARLPCGEFARNPARTHMVPLFGVPRTGHGIPLDAEGWATCLCGEHRVRWIAEVSNE